MKTKKIEKRIFNILMLLPILLVLVYFCLNFATLWSTGNNITTGIVISNFNDILTNIGGNSDFTMPVKYLLHDIFNINETLSSSISIYFMYLVVIELIHLLYNLINYLPKLLRSLVERGVND